MLGFSLPVQQNIVFWLWAVTAVGGGLAVTGSLLSAIISNNVAEQTQKIAEEQLDKYKTQAGVEIETAKAQAAGALSKVAEAELASKALSLELEQAKVRIAELQANFAWRTLSQSQIDALVSELRKSYGNVHFQWVNGDPEAFSYANELAVIFRMAGWANTGDSIVVSTAAVGISIPDRLMADPTRIRAAMTLAGITFNNDQPPYPVMVIGKNDTADQVLVFVGSKPRPGIAP